MKKRRTIALSGIFALSLFALVGGLAPPEAIANDAHTVARTIMDEHNRERARYGLDDLTWSRSLARDAQDWADELARAQAMFHSSSDQRGRTGENLWSGSAGYFTPTQMMDGFLRERSDFRKGTFPDVSRTGNWADVGHYTQIIWPETREVGCAIARSDTTDYLVCRYAPAGNVIGRPVG